VEAVRSPGRGLLDPPVWTVRRCPYCRRRHVHVADVSMTEMVLQSRCGGGTRFYLVREGRAAVLPEASPVGEQGGERGCR